MNAHTTISPGNPKGAASATEKIEARIGDLQTLTRRGWQELILFLLVSTGFFCIRQADLLAPLTESARLFLGCPPPPLLTTLALVGYTLSAAVLILGRAASGARPALKWSHAGLRIVFYLFYGTSGALEENFMTVFVAGLGLIVLEQLNIWTYSLKTLPRGRQLQGKL